MPDAAAPAGHTEEYLGRYESALVQVFGRPQLVLEHGDGAWVWDVDGRRYLDLVGGLAVNALGHNHPALVAAVSKQAGQLVHVSNFYTSVPQVELAERILQVADAPAGSAVFFCSSGAEAIEAAVKLARRTGRTGIVAAEGAFHGRTTGALALTHKPAYREPFEPLLPGVVHVPWGDVAALEAAVGADTSAVVLEPIQGEGGVVPASAEFLRAARELTTAAGALLVLDEIQTGVGRTGSWFAWQQAGVVPDAMTLAKGLGGGIPIGALVTFGPEVSGMLTAGQHGSTFGGNPLACAAGLAVLDTIESEGLLAHVRAAGEHLERRIHALGDPRVTGIRGSGLLRAVTLAGPWSPAVAAHGREAGLILNPVAPDAVRLAPPLVVTTDQLDLFVDALPGLLDLATEETR
ncbi:acetylornithine transaminase [Phycicoccus avicenniae]|uniref:acetylornithine transaminase n=1 Tax=Phycicoccus avicenniae TaxID=2828860 RepID=UPI003D2E46A2